MVTRPMPLRDNEDQSRPTRSSPLPVTSSPPAPAPASQHPPPPLPIRVLTHNIRYAATSLLPGEEPWPVRRPRLCAALTFHTRHNPAALICLQEALHGQLVDVLESLNQTQDLGHDPRSDNTPEWTYIGVGRDDGRTAGEYSPILYRPSVWSLTRSRTVWLSPTPETPSRGWDAGCVRILTVAVLKHVATGREVVVMNTHLDNAGPVSRRESAKIIIERLREYCGCESDNDDGGDGSGNDAEGERTARRTPMPVILTGDLNSPVGDDAYELLAGKESPVQDLRGFVEAERRYGHGNTYTGFEGKEGDKQRIDFLFLGPRAGVSWGVEGYGVLENRFEDGVYLSDHRAVVGDVVLT